MKIIGFNFTKIHAEKMKAPTKLNMNNNIEFTNVEKESVEMLKDSEAVKLSFKYSLIYSSKDEKEIKEEDKDAEVSFEGFVILSLEKDEAKDFQKAWKKKQIPKDATTPLYNFILKRCAPKAIPLQDDLQIPSPYLKIPQVKPQED